MSMNKTSQLYLSYLLRLWRVESEKGPIWRASLQSPHTAERMNFNDLSALYSYLEEKLLEFSKDQNAKEGESTKL